MNKSCKIQYLKGEFFRAQEKLSIYTPSDNGYLRYDFHHSLVKEINCDCWRIDMAYRCDDNLLEIERISESGEWECALRIKDRCDFSGGVAHGDEVFEDIKLLLDGKDVCIEELSEIKGFFNLLIIENSKLYDPSDNCTIIAEHKKEYVFSKAGLTLGQSVTWKGDYEIESSYLAMFPVSKKVTDRVSFEGDESEHLIAEKHSFNVTGCKWAKIFSEEKNFYAEFSVSEYPKGYEGGDELLLLDNGGGAYNKMYYKICSEGEVHKNEVWTSKTHYKIMLG